MLRAYFNFKNNAYDTSGNGFHGTIQGSGPAFETSQPIPLTGTRCTVDFTDANWISLPPSIFAEMVGQGTMQYSIYYRNGDIGGNRLPFRSRHGGAGDFYIEWGGTMIMLYPTNQGVKVAYSAALTRKDGRWYTIIISWDASGLDVWILDTVTGVRQHAFDLHPLPDGALPYFPVGTNIWLGRSDGDGYSFQGAMDNVAFYTTKITAPEQEIPERRFFYTFGHSWCRGLGSTTGDGFRKELFSTAGELGMRFDCYGTYTDGTEIVCPYTNGESGHTSAQILSDLETRLSEIGYGTNDKSVLILGPSSLTDIIYGVSAATHETNIKACLTAIYGYSPHLKIFVVTQNVSPLYGTTQDYDDFLAAEIEAVAWGKRQGYWVELIDAYSNISVALSGDDIHPSDAGYAVLGEYIAQQIYYYLTHQQNAVYLKRSLLRTISSFQFRLNLGSALSAAVNIPVSQITNLGTVSEKLSKSDVNSGGVLLPNLEIKLDNKFGRWNKDAGYFKNGFINGSEFTITTQYYDENNITVIPAYVYRGLIKYVSCEWDRINFKFEATLIPATSLLTSEKIAAGILSHTTFKNICYKILHRNPFTRHMTIDADNFEMGWDVTAIDSYADMTHKKVKEVLDKIMLLTGSVYYVDYDGKFIIEPVIPANPLSVCTLRGQDIISLNSEGFDWESQYTGITWDDNENEIQRVEMGYPDRQKYQYDFRELTLNEKYVTDSAKRLEILNNLLTLYKFLKRKIKLTCKWNPDIIVNKYISLDVPAEAVAGDQFLVWNKSAHNWNQGLYWGFQQPGLSFDPTKLWRVVDIKRAARGEKMDLEVVQLTSDDEA